MQLISLTFNMFSGGRENINVHVVYYHYYSFVGIHIFPLNSMEAKLIHLLSFSQGVAASKKLNKFPGLWDSA